MPASIRVMITSRSDFSVLSDSCSKRSKAEKKSCRESISLAWKRVCVRGEERTETRVEELAICSKRVLRLESRLPANTDRGCCSTGTE